MKNRNIVILGGDNRQRYLSQILKSEFEKLYDNMVKYAEENGLNDATFEEFNNYYVNELNKDYMHYIEEKKAEIAGK